MRLLCLISFAALSSWLLPACTGEKSHTENKNNTSIQASFYKHYEGKVGGYAITMDLTASDSSLTGSYYYNSTGLPLQLEGNMKPENKFKLVVRNEEGTIVETFSGAFANSDSLKGEWHDERKNKTLKFYLVAAMQDLAECSNLHFERKNCEHAEKMKKLPPDSLQWDSDTACTMLSLDLLTLKLNDQKVTDKINLFILKDVCEDKSRQDTAEILRAFLSRVDSAGDGGFDESITVSLTFNDKLILGVNICWFSYWYGAAHPNSACRALNFDTRSGQLITLNDILKPGYEKVLNPYAEKKLNGLYPEESWFFEPGEFKLNDDFEISPAGLTFDYDKYEIASYASGGQQLFLSFDEIKKWIKPGCVLDQWLSAKRGN